VLLELLVGPGVGTLNVNQDTVDDRVPLPLDPCDLYVIVTPFDLMASFRCQEED